MVDATAIRRKVLREYQGWFRTPGDPSGEGFVHRGRDPKALTPRSLTVEMWPDVREVPTAETSPVAGSTHPDGQPAALFSSANPAVVRRHFAWIRRHAIDGVFLHHFLVDCPGGPLADRFESRRAVLDHVRAAATAAGRTCALTIDLSGMPRDQIPVNLAREWRRLVDSGVTADPRYLHEAGGPVVSVFGFSHGAPDDRMTAEEVGRIIEPFHPDPVAGDAGYAAFLIGSGAWNWRRTPDPVWQAGLGRLDGISPWDVGNTTRLPDGSVRATTNYWRGDKAEAERRGQLWLPVVYPGFG